MGAIFTGTVCPFPMVFPPGVNSTKVSDCTMTYAERLGSGHNFLQAVLIIVSLSSLSVLLYRMYRLKQYTVRKNVSFINFPTFPYFFFASLFSFFVMFESIDVFAFRGVFPPALYYILDEFCASSLISIAIVLVDFWVRCAKGMGKQSFGLGVREKYAIIALCYWNFVGFIIVGVLDAAKFELWEALKAFCGAGIIIYFQIRSGMAVYELHRTLKTSLGISDQPNAPSVQESERQKRNKAAVSVLVRKYSQFSILLVLGACALIADAFLSLHLDDGASLQWRVVFDEQYDPVQIVLRIVYMLACLASLSFFEVPKEFNEQISSTAGSAQKLGSTSQIFTTVRNFFSKESQSHKQVSEMTSAKEVTSAKHRSMKDDSTAESHPHQQSIVVISDLNIYETKIKDEDDQDPEASTVKPKSVSRLASIQRVLTSPLRSSSTAPKVSSTATPDY